MKHTAINTPYSDKIFWLYAQRRGVHLQESRWWVDDKVVRLSIYRTCYGINLSSSLFEMDKLSEKGQLEQIINFFL